MKIKIIGINDRSVQALVSPCEQNLVSGYQTGHVRRTAWEGENSKKKNNPGRLDLYLGLRFLSMYVFIED